MINKVHKAHYNSPIIYNICSDSSLFENVDNTRNQYKNNPPKSCMWNKKGNCQIIKTNLVEFKRTPSPSPPSPSPPSPSPSLNNERNIKTIISYISLGISIFFIIILFYLLWKKYKWIIFK